MNLMLFVYISYIYSNLKPRDFKGLPFTEWRGKAGDSTVLYSLPAVTLTPVPAANEHLKTQTSTT